MSEQITVIDYLTGKTHQVTVIRERVVGESAPHGHKLVTIDGGDLEWVPAEFLVEADVRRAVPVKQATLVDAQANGAVVAAEIRSARDAEYVRKAGGRIYDDLAAARHGAMCLMENLSPGEVSFSKTIRIQGLRVAILETITASAVA